MNIKGQVISSYIILLQQLKPGSWKFSMKVVVFLATVPNLDWLIASGALVCEMNAKHNGMAAAGSWKIMKKLL